MHLPRLARMTATSLCTGALLGVAACSQPAGDDADAGASAAPESTDADEKSPDEKQAVEEGRRFLIASNELTRDMLDALDMHKADDDATGEKMTSAMAGINTLINDSVFSDMVDETRATDAGELDPARIDWDEVDSTLGNARARTEKSLEVIPDMQLDFEKDSEDTGKIKLPLERLDMKKEDGQWKVCDRMATGEAM